MSDTFLEYAQYYDLLYKEKDYKAEAEFLAKLLNTHGVTDGLLLDMGCGTGLHSEHLAQMNYEVDGIDISQSMIDQANTQLQTLPTNIRHRLSYQHGDVRSFRTNKIYDVVVSLFHVVSYQLSNEDLLAMFINASNHLQTGGLFVFDCWYGPAVLSNHPEVRVKRVADEHIDILRIAEPVMHPTLNTVDVNYTFFVTGLKKGVIQKFKETHKMRYLFSPEIHLMLKDAGFVVLDELESTGGKLDLDSWNATFIAQKV